MTVIINGTTGITSPEVVLDNSAADGGQVVLKSSGYSNWNWDNYSGRLRAYYNVTEYFTIDTSGNVGIGTSSPDSKLAVYNATGTSQIRFGASSNYYWDISRDNDTTGSLWFSNYNATGSRTTRMVIDSSGNVGIGTSSPTEKLMVNGSIRVTSNANDFNVLGGQFDFATNATRISAYNSTGGIIQFFTNASGGTVLERARINSSGQLLFNCTGQTGDAPNTAGGRINETNGNEKVRVTIDGLVAFQFYSPSGGTGSPVGTITVNASTTSYNSSSDYRLKENIAPMTGALAKVIALKPCTYTWKNTGKAGEGFIAHELAEVVPDCVTGEKDAVDADGNPVYQGIDTSFLVATLTAAIQEQQAIIQTLTARIEALEAK